jgi:hypothetical protein
VAVAVAVAVVAPVVVAVHVHLNAPVVVVVHLNDFLSSEAGPVSILSSIPEGNAYLADQVRRASLSVTARRCCVQVHDNVDGHRSRARARRRPQGHGDGDGDGVTATATATGSRRRPPCSR